MSVTVTRRSSHRYRTVIAAVATIVLCSAVGNAQFPESRPVDLPDGPAKPGFDISRFSGAGNGWFETFYVEDTERLQDVLAAARVAEDTRLLVANTAGGRLAFITDQMAYHHIAEGTTGGRDWLVSF